MKDVLTYKNFVGSVHFSAEDRTFHGKIEGVNDLVTFEGDTVERLEKAFREAVEDYVALCREAGKEPRKSYMGSFNVRVSPSVHKDATEYASLLGVSLNQFVQKALEDEVDNAKRSLSGRRAGRRIHTKTKA